MPRKYGKVWNVTSREAKENIVIDYLLWIDVSGSFKTEYLEGELFEPQGIIITAHFADGTSKQLDAYSDSAEWKYYPNIALTSKNSFITVSYSYYNKTASVNIPITVNKQYVEQPYILEESFTYNGQLQSPTIENYDKQYMVITGDFSATNAGSYTLTATLLDENLTFKDTENLKSITLDWTIDKAVRPLTLSTDLMYFDDSNLRIPYSIYLNYPGNTPFKYKVSGDISNFQYYFFPNQKYFTIQCDFGQTSRRMDIEFYVDGDENYLDSKKITFSAITMYWDWGKEDGTSIADMGTEDWFDGLMNKISIDGVDQTWIGKKKVIRFNGANAMFDSQQNIQFTCVDVNKDAPDSVSFFASYVPNQSRSFNINTYDDLSWGYDNPDEAMANPNVMDAMQFMFFYKTINFFEQYFPAQKYLLSQNKRYWNGLNINKIEGTFFIPSASELGVTNALIDTYIGGQGVEYSENVRNPYAYFTSNDKRILKSRSGNVPKKYWTRSTADSDKSGDTGINANQIVINESGIPEELIKTDKTKAHAAIMFTVALGGEQEDEQGI